MSLPLTPSFRLDGKRALVTGAGRGIGLAAAAALAQAGAHVTLVSRTRSEIESAARSIGEAGGKADAKALDVTDIEAVGKFFGEADAYDILVNNAGQAASAPFDRTDPALWERMLAVNLTGTYLGMRAALPGMLELGWGRIVNIASTASLKGYAYIAAYCAAKHGVLGLTRALAAELARKPVTVNAVCPGYTETDIVRETLANIRAKTGRSLDEARMELVKHNPQGRLVQPEEVANAVLWLCQPGSESVTGQAISISGGETT